MKKSLIAMAVLAAASGAAMAQSSVTLSGIFKSGLAQTKYSNAPAGSTAATGSGTGLADGSSRFIISGSEDMGGGLRANFQADTRFRIDDNGGAPTSSPLAGGNTFIGLSGGFGDFRMGKLDSHYCLGSDEHGTRATALQASSCALLGYVNGGTAAQAIAVTSRSVNMIRYTTPNMGGFSAILGYSPSFGGSEGPVGAAGKGDATHLQVRYAGGPLAAGLSFWNAKTEGKTAKQSAWTGMVSYNFGIAKVGLTYDDSAITTGLGTATAVKSKRNVTSIPVVVPVGTGSVLFTWSKAGKVKANGATLGNTDSSLISIGYEHPLSKRTSLGVSYARLNNKSAAGYQLYTQTGLHGTPGNGVGVDASQFYMGLRHTF